MAAAAVVSSFLFLVLISLEILHSAGEEEWSKKCPPFSCGNFTASGLLFTDNGKGRPGCGFFPIKGCNETVQKIQLEKGGGRWYTVEGITKGDKPWEKINIIIHDNVFFQSCDCEFFFNLSLPNIPFPFFHISSRVDILNCSKSLPNDSIPENFNKSHGSCNNRSVYYKILDDFSPNTTFNVPSDCSLVIDSPLQKFSQTKGLFTPFTDKLSLNVDILHFCLECRNVSECPAFCTNNGKGKLPLKLGLGIAGSTVFLIILSLLIIKFRAYIQKHGSSNFARGNPSSNLSCTSDLVVLVGVGVPLFSYAELEEATNNFDDKKELGNGGFGTVYHGKG